MTAAPDVPPLHVRVMGVTVAIDVPDEATSARLARQWSRALVPAGGGPAGETVQAGSSPSEDLDARDYRVATEVTLAGLVSTRGSRINLHAGGLADGVGRVLALVAASGTGKTTATRLLAQRLGYVSDETVSLDPDGKVHPHPKPLSVLTDPARPGHKEQLSPDELGLLPTPTEATLARFVLLRRGVPEPRGLVPVDTVDGLLELIEQSSYLGAVPDALATLVSLLGRGGGVWALEYDEIADHVEDLVGLLAADLPPVTGATPATHPGADVPVVAPEGHLARAPWVDAVELGDELVVLLDGRALRLDGLMVTVWRELETPRTLDELVAVAQERHGSHPEALDLIRQAVEVMVEQALVARGPLA